MSKIKRMNPEIKQKWLVALRSGEYKQGKNYLHQGDSFCCLGVLCDVYLKEQEKQWAEYSSMSATQP